MAVLMMPCRFGSLETAILFRWVKLSYILSLKLVPRPFVACSAISAAAPEELFSKEGQTTY
jgi:hypothetical protein